MQKFNYHSHTYRCGHADLDMKDEEYIQEVRSFVRGEIRGRFHR